MPVARRCLGDFSYNSLFPAAQPILIVSGASPISVVAASNILLQHLVPEYLRWRVMALFTMAFWGMLPPSALRAGGGWRVWLASSWPSWLLD